MGYLSIIFFFSTAYFIWRTASRNLERAGRGWLFRHWIASTLALTFSVIQTILFNSDDWIGVFIAFALVGISIFVANRNSTAAVDPEPMASSTEFKLSETAKSIYAADAGQSDLLVKWNESATRRATRHDVVSESEKKRIRHGKCLDVVNFDYVNGEGEFSQRRIKVTMAGEWQFEGIDLDKHAQRTFRYDRVVGSITSELTGEMLTADEWAASVGGKSFSTTEEKDPDDDAETNIEICFTGFNKADKSRMEAMAETAGMRVRHSVTNGLTHLCMGAKEAPRKRIDAEVIGAEVIDEAGFYSLYANS